MTSVLNLCTALSPVLHGWREAEEENNELPLSPLLHVALMQSEQSMAVGSSIGDLCSPWQIRLPAPAWCQIQAPPAALQSFTSELKGLNKIDVLNNQF